MMKRLAIVLALVCAPQAAAQDTETRVYGAAQSCTGLRAYLRNYPNGRFTADARARLARDCAEPAAPRPAAAPAPLRTPTGDQCVQARADWTNIASTRDIPVLRAFRDGAPAACAVQRAQAQSRIEVLEGEKAAADRKVAEWNGVPEFEGTWVKVSGPCIAHPWRFRPLPGSQFEFLRSDDQGRTTELFFESLLSVERTTPPTLVNSDTKYVVEGDRIIRTSSTQTCIIRRQ